MQSSSARAAAALRCERHSERTRRDGGAYRSLAEIGARLSLTKEGVRGIQVRALEKLRQSMHADVLSDWWRTA